MSKMETVSLNSTCVQQFWNPSSSSFAALNISFFNITSTCQLTHNEKDPSSISQLLIALSVIIFVVSFFVAAVGSSRHTLLIEELRHLPAYEVHEMIEERYARTLKGMEKDLYKSNWKGRYLDIKWKDDEVEKTRTTVIVEDFRKIPPADHDYKTDKYQREALGNPSLARNCEVLDGLVANPSPLPLRQTPTFGRKESMADSLPGIDADVPPPSYAQEPRRQEQRRPLGRSSLLHASPIWEALRE